jgi:hypothetical protein
MLTARLQETGAFTYTINRYLDIMILLRNSTSSKMLSWVKTTEKEIQLLKLKCYSDTIFRAYQNFPTSVPFIHIQLQLVL